MMQWYVRLALSRTEAKIQRLPKGAPISVSLLGSTLSAYSHRTLEFLVDEVFIAGCYDIGSLPSRPVIVDCGANIGVATFYFVHTYPGCTVLSFEPDPTAYKMLVRNIEQNEWANVTPHNLGLDRQNGQIDFYIGSNTQASLRMSGIRERQLEGDTTSVECVRLSEMMPERVDLLKIDVEGMEWNILDDLQDSGALTRVDRLCIEYHHHLPGDRDDLANFLGRLEDAGFGYQIGASHRRGQLGSEFQDVMVYAYRKG